MAKFNNATDLSLKEKIDVLKEKAEALGGKFILSEDDFIDETHLNCFWYDSGQIGAFEYKGYSVSVEVHGDISLFVLDENREEELLSYVKKNYEGAFKNEEVLAVIKDDATFAQLNKDGRLAWSLNNWVEFLVFDENDKQVDSQWLDNVLENDVFVAISDLDGFVELVESIIKDKIKQPLENQIQSAINKNSSTPVAYQGNLDKSFEL